MEQTSSQTEQLLTQEPPLEKTVEPLAVSIEDIFIKNETCTDDPEEVSPLYVNVDIIKKEVPDFSSEPGCSNTGLPVKPECSKTDLVGEPGCSKWDDQNAPGPSSTAVKIDPESGLPYLKEIKSEPPHPLVKQEGSSDGDSSIPDDHFVDDGTMSSIKSEPDDVEMKTEEQLKEEEVMLGDDEAYNEIRNKRCPLKTNLKKHLQLTDKQENGKEEDEIYRFKCTHCSFKSKYNIALNRHLRNHKGKDEIRWFHCMHCNYKTNCNGSLKEHFLKHKIGDEIIWFPCLHCSFKTKRKGNLKQHLLMHKRKDEINWLQCTQCSFKAKRQGNLREHFLTHKEVDEIHWFWCPQCSFKTKRSTDLKRHLVTHKKEDDGNWFQCPYCSFKSKYSSCLNRHLVIHKADDKIN